MNKIDAILRLISLLMCLFASLPCASGRGISKPHPGDEGSPQKTAFDHMKAQVTAQIEGHQIDPIAGVLLSEPYEGASWQAAAFALDEYFQRQAPLSAHAPLIQRAFSASIKPKDHWLLYDNIVNFQTPYRLRRQLALCLTVIRTGQPGRTIPEVELLSENPAKWLDKWGRLPTVVQPATKDIKPVATDVNSENKPIPHATQNQASPAVAKKQPQVGIRTNSRWVWVALALGGLGLLWALGRASTTRK